MMHLITKPWALSSLLLLAMLAQHARADESSLQGFQLHWDNDFFAKDNHDRWYTNGIRATWSLKNKVAENALSRNYQEASRWFLWEESEPTLSYSIGQLMYSPAEIGDPNPQPNDRPWGAYLFASITAHSYKPGTEPGENRDAFRATELKIGWTGPSSLGDTAQKTIHRIISDTPPAGWHQQLKERLGIQLSHAQVYRINDTPGKEYVGAQWGWGGTVGTLRTHGNVNAALLVGNLKDKNSPLLISNEGDYVVQDFNNRAQFEHPYAFVAASLTGVVSNYFVDGTTPYGRPDLKRKAGYSVVQWGVSLPLQNWLGNKWPRLLYTQSTRSPEFSSPLIGKKESWQRWGSLTVIWDFDD
jgi:lipid A 3-O-deacylase